MSFSFPFFKIALSNLFSKPSTRNFPAVNVDAMPDYRGRISYDPEKCVNCGMCVKVCSPSAITRTFEPVEGGEKITYEFDMTSCTFCRMCEDFCNEKAIHLTTDYHLVAEDPKDLITVGERIKKKVAGSLTCGEDCVFCGLCARSCPQGAITVDRATKTWKVDTEKCVKCGICVSKCPKKCLAFAEPKLQCSSEDCVFCGLCSKKCPAGAINVDRANKVWEVDSEKCQQCGICVGACPKKALEIK